MSQRSRSIAFERYNLVCWKQPKNESLEQFHADLVELASRVESSDREDERVRDIITAHLSYKKISKELLPESQQVRGFCRGRQIFPGGNNNP